MIPSSARRLVLLLVAAIHIGAASAQAQDLRARIDGLVLATARVPPSGNR